VTAHGRADHTAAMHRFASHLQVLAGRLTNRSPTTLIDEFDQLAQDIPTVGSRVEQLAVGELLCEALRRLHQALQSEPDSLCACCLTKQTFRDALGVLRVAHLRARPMRISQFRDVLQRRYAESGLSVAKVAESMRLSPCHLTRLLTRHTGHGFPFHLHTKRIARAKQLLAESTLSMKEISGLVGYLRTTQFDRRFRQELGVTPSEYRHFRASIAPRTWRREIVSRRIGKESREH
jgi:AraC-like DNA-binding protein